MRHKHINKQTNKTSCFTHRKYTRKRTAPRKSWLCGVGTRPIFSNKKKADTPKQAFVVLESKVAGGEAWRRIVHACRHEQLPTSRTHYTIKEVADARIKV